VSAYNKTSIFCLESHVISVCEDAARELEECKKALTRQEPIRGTALLVRHILTAVLHVNLGATRSLDCGSGCHLKEIRVRHVWKLVLHGLEQVQGKGKA